MTRLASKAPFRRPRPARGLTPAARRGKADPEVTVSRYFEACGADGRPLPVFAARHPGRSLRALVALGRLPCVHAALSASPEGTAIRTQLLRNSAFWRMTGFATPALPVPPEPGQYALGASKQTLRRQVRNAERLSIRWEEVDDAQERRNLLKLANDSLRAHPDATYRTPNPDNDDLLRYRLWLVARAADGRPLLLSVTPVEGEVAWLRFFRTLGSGEEQTKSRYFMTEVLAERLVTLGVRYLIDGSHLVWLPNGLRHFQQMTGFQIVRIRVTRPRRSGRSRAGHTATASTGQVR